MYKSHLIINSNGCPSFFLLTSAHRLFITQAPLISVNTHSLSLSPSLFFTPQWRSGCSQCSQTHSYLSTLVLAVLSTWNALPHCSWLTPPLHSGLCSNITSFKKPFPPPYLQCLPCPSLPAPFNLVFFNPCRNKATRNFGCLPRQKKTGREITLPSFTYFIFLHSTCHYLEVSYRFVYWLPPLLEYKTQGGRDFI